MTTRIKSERLLKAAQLGLLLWCATSTVATAADGVRFNRDIRPILSDSCFSCHGPDKNQRKAKLRLDLREVALERGAIVPGKPGESELVRRIFATDEDDVMPPPEVHKDLSQEQKNLLRRWVAEGAVYEPHWAYINPVRPEVPRPEPGGWVQTPVDAFILQALASRGIKPSPEADRRTLLRRLSLDLIGLPPAPSEISAFLGDGSPQAYERAVNRLLESPHFGERMAVPWLDVVRFADTVGYHGDQNVNVFPYRDYVINSFNRNKPFDQFTIEQLAGDLLSHPTAEQQVATGFNRLNMMTREGGAQPKEYLAKYAADRVRTVGMTWLGATMGCAECHDHKFDPISTKDFYSMAAYFADIKQWGVYQDYGYTPNPDLKGWSNDHPFPPEMEVESPYLRQRMEKIRGQIGELAVSAVAPGSNSPPTTTFNEWKRQARAFLEANPSGWLTPQPEATVTVKENNAENPSRFTVNPDRSVLLQTRSGDTVELRLPLSSGRLSAVRLELLPREEHGGSIIRGGGSNTSIALAAHLKNSGAGEGSRLRFYHAEADHLEDRYSNGFAQIGVQGLWRTSSSDSRQPHTAVYLLDQPVEVATGDTLTLSLGGSAVGCVRVSLSPFVSLDPLESDFAQRLRQGLQNDEAEGSSRELLAVTHLASTGGDPATFARYKKLYREVLECRKGRAMTVVTEAWEPTVTRVLPRGNWLDESGEIVQPAPPHFLPQPPNPEGRRLTRLDLARWIVSPENPLTARTIVNRLWKQFLGTGLSAVVDDLGMQGEAPSHPELLDWLAVEFRESGWNVKHLIRLIVTSATYRQDSNLRLALRDADPDNRLLASQNPRRLEAEFVRDNALHIAGLLNPDLGGPSVHPYQPGGYYANLQFPDREYQPELDERQYRRGVYTHWQRTFLHPMLANFDAPSREECTAFRVVSNTPQQALTLLNDPSFTEAARVFAQHLLQLPGRSVESRLTALYEKALARPARARELESLRLFLAAQRAHYADDIEEARRLLSVGAAARPASLDDIELAAWTQVCRVVFNLHETITAY